MSSSNIKDDSVSVSIDTLRILGQSIVVCGNNSHSMAVNVEVESDSIECHLEKIMETFICEFQSCTSKNSFSITDLMYMRIFYVQEIMDHWDAQHLIQRSLEGTIAPAPAFSLIPVDGLEKGNAIMLFCCFLQKQEEEVLE